MWHPISESAGDGGGGGGDENDDDTWTHLYN